MPNEDDARQQIDALLRQAGWVIQDKDRLNLGAGMGVAIREFQMTTGPVDYLLFVNREAVGTVEAKKAGTPLTGVESQNTRYREGIPERVISARIPLPFAYETTGIETHFTSSLDPHPRSRAVFAFHQPQTLAAWLRKAPVNGTNTSLRTLMPQLPTLNTQGLRDCQIEAITKLEQSFALDRPRALVQMATGSGKTYTAISSIYRLLKFGGAQRVLFLVDRANLGRQASLEFSQYQTPDDGRKFTELYSVQHLQSNHLDSAAQVVITTIQRLYSMLSGEAEYDPTNEEGSLFELDAALAKGPKKVVNYNPAIPIETFDIIFTDECHRSIYGLWRGVLEYFDAHLIGLTATPNKQTFGFFNQNLVMEYGHERAVADGVNVDYQVYRIRTTITEQGSTIEKGYYVDRRDRQTRAKRWETLDDDLVYTLNQLDREVVATDQIRTVIKAFKDALKWDLFPGREEAPKTLIFAKDDSHADDIVQIVREEFVQGNDFVQKITYRTTGKKAEDLISDFRNSYYPRIAVTVDMIATGTDIKPLEVLLFMRMVKSRGHFEQMKGRGSRTITDTDLQGVTPLPASKTHFVIVDAVGVCEVIKTDTVTLDRKRSIPLAQLLEAVALNKRDEDTLATLAGRLGRLATRLKPDEARTIAQAAEGKDLRALANLLIQAIDPDQQLAAAQDETGHSEPDAAAISVATQRLVAAATAPFDSPDLRDAINAAQRRDEQVIDNVSQDAVMESAFSPQAEEAARQSVESFRAFMEQHRDEITALQILFNRPQRQLVQLRDIKLLADAILVPPLGLSTDKLWQAYVTLDQSRVRGATIKHLTADLVALVRYTMERERNPVAVLEPYAVQVQRRFTEWLTKQEAQRGPFTADQRQWLELIRDHVAASLTIDRTDFDGTPFTERGGLGRAYQLFGDQLDTILTDLNEGLAA